MKSKESIDNEIEALKIADKWGTKSEIKILPKILNEEETIVALCSGLKMKMFGLRPEWHPVLAVCTTKRVVFINERLFKTDIDEVNVSNINSVSKKEGFMLSEISLEINNQKKALKLKDINKEAATAFVNAIQREQNKPEKNRNVGSTSTGDELIKLKQLLDEGVLTEEEFKLGKDKILRR